MTWKKLMLMAPAAFNLAETTRMVEIAKGVRADGEASRIFDVRFISEGGDFEKLIGLLTDAAAKDAAAAYAGSIADWKDGSARAARVLVEHYGRPAEQVAEGDKSA